MASNDPNNPPLSPSATPPQSAKVQVRRHDWRVRVDSVIFGRRCMLKRLVLGVANPCQAGGCEMENQQCLQSNGAVAHKLICIDSIEVAGT